MASSHGGSSSAQQPFASPKPAPIIQSPDTHPAVQAASPPTKQNLKTWWKGFSSRQAKPADGKEDQPSGIFGVPLRQSITYANVAISLVDAEGRSYIYGYVPIVVAKCGVFLKEKATNVEGIFRLSGSEKRIKELRTIFDSPDRYGKGLDWNGYTVHDAANVLRRYLNQLPEPIIPLDLYERFREPLRGHLAQAVGDQQGPQDSGDFNLDHTITVYQQLITELPPLNRQLLLYILDLLAVFASKSDENRMTAANLAAIFQPGILSHPEHDMAPHEYRLSQDVLVFLIENQDHFLIGMRGTAVDEKTVQDVQKGGTPPPSTPVGSKGMIDRSSSNASAGAESLRRQGGVRRNVSVNSRHSRQSNGAPSPASPAFGSSLTQTSSGSGVHRSNTVPSKKSPALPTRLQKTPESRSPAIPQGFSTHNASEGGHVSIFQDSPAADTVVAGSASDVASTVVGPSITTSSNVVGPGQSQDQLLPESDNKVEAGSQGQTQSQRTLFPRTATMDSDKRQPNKLRKKRIPGSSNPSAQSSTNSLHAQMESVSPGMPAAQSMDAGELSQSEDHPQLDYVPAAGAPVLNTTTATPPSDQPVNATPSTGFLQAHAHHPSDATLKPQASANSLRSRDMSDQSDLDHGDDPVVAEQKEKRKLFRLSRRKEDASQSGSHLSTPAAKNSVSGGNNAADTSTTSLGSGRPRKSFSNETAPVATGSSFTSAQQFSSNDSGDGSAGKDEKQGPIGWLKNKVREAKEEKRERDAAKEKERGAKANSDRAASKSPMREVSRGKSMDVHENEPESIPEAPEGPKAEL